MLDAKMYINAGCKPGLHKEHLVFWSLKDNCAFVAIRDSLKGELITILPLDYHLTTAWRISDAHQEKARRFAILYEQYNNQQKSVPSKFKASVGYLCNGAPRTKEIKTVASEQYDHCLEQFVQRFNYAKLPQLCERKGINFSDVCYLILRHGNRGEPVIIDHLHQLISA